MNDMPNKLNLIGDKTFDFNRVKEEIIKKSTSSKQRWS